MCDSDTIRNSDMRSTELSRGPPVYGLLCLEFLVCASCGIMLIVLLN